MHLMPSRMRHWFCTTPTDDAGKGFDGLSGLVRNHLSQEPMKGADFLAKIVSPSCDDFFPKVSPGSNERPNEQDETGRGGYTSAEVLTMPVVVGQPNPMVVSADIRYSVFVDGLVEITLCNAFGARVVTLVGNQYQAKGYYHLPLVKN